MARTPPLSINRLSRANARKLEDYVHANYVASAQTDAAFAKHATEALGFAVTDHSVAGARRVFDIPSNREALRAAVRTHEDLPSRVAYLERELAGLKTAFDVFKHGCRGDGK